MWVKTLVAIAQIESEGCSNDAFAKKME